MEILHEDNVKTEYLYEDKRSQLLSKGRGSINYKDDDKFKSRYQRRIKSRLSSSVANYNKMDMNKLFKQNILDISIEVEGETNKYLVKISFGQFLDKLQDSVARQHDTFDFRAVSRALISAFNASEVFVSCSCPDWQYRHAYQATKHGFNSGEAELRPSDITNPDDNKGGYCKHVSLVLANTSWLMKVASVITNYVNYMKEKQPSLYQKIIYPAIYGKDYEEDEQLTFEDELMSDSDTLNTTNKFAKEKNQFKPGNNAGIRFTSNKPDDQLKFDDSEENKE